MRRGSRRRPEPDTVPCRWDGSQLRCADFTPPWKERTEPTGLRFASAEAPHKAVARLAATLGCYFDRQGDTDTTAQPDLISPAAGGSSHIAIELTTRPHHLITTLTAIGLAPLPSTSPKLRDDEG